MRANQFVGLTVATLLFAQTETATRTEHMHFGDRKQDRSALLNPAKRRSLRGQFGAPESAAVSREGLRTTEFAPRAAGAEAAV